MAGIVETFLGEYIDLDKVVSISKARFIDRMGWGGYYVGFEIKCQLLKEPIVFERKLEHDEYEYTPIPIDSKFPENGYRIIYGNDNSTPLAVIRLQKQIDDLVQQWIDYKNSK